MSSTTTQPTHHKLNPWLRLVQAAVLLVWSRRRYWNPWLLLVPVIILILIPGAERFQGSNLVELGMGSPSQYAQLGSSSAVDYAVLILRVLPELAGRDGRTRPDRHQLLLVSHARQPRPKRAGILKRRASMD